MTIWHLMKQAAKHLTGRAIVLRLQKPVIKGYSATVTKDAAGVPVLDIDPTLQDDDFISVFVHELAHVKIHMGAILPTNTQRPPESVTVKLSPLAQRHYNRREDEAEKLAARWMERMNRTYKRYDGYTVLEQKLNTLANMEAG